MTPLANKENENNICGALLRYPYKVRDHKKTKKQEKHVES